MYKVTLKQLSTNYGESATSYSISDVDPSINTIYVAGDATSDFSAGDRVRIKNGSPNNGDYGISLVVYDFAYSSTRIMLSELGNDKLANIEAPDAGNGDIVKLTTSSSYSNEVNHYADASQNTFDVVNMNDLERTLEIEAGKFKIDNVSVTAQGLDHDYFRNYTNMFKSPFIFIVQNSNDDSLVWHGVVDPTSCKYNAKTKYTAFDVLSWDFAFGRFKIPARSIFEVETVKESSAEDNTLYLPEFGKDGIEVQRAVLPEDVAVIDSTEGELRERVKSTTLNGSVVEASIENNGTDTYETTVQYTHTTGSYGSKGDFTVEDEELARFLNAQQGEKVLIVARLDSNYAETYRGTLETGEVDGQAIYYRIRNGEDVIFDTRDWFVGAGLSDGTHSVEFSITAYVGVKKGGGVRFLSNEIYGYRPGASKPQVSQIVDSIPYLPSYESFALVYDGVTLRNGMSDQTLPIGIEFPEKPSETIKLLMNTVGWFYQIVPTLDVNDEPKFEIHLTDRDNVNETDISPTSVVNITEWNEDSVDRSPDAVIVKPNEEYVKPADYEGEVVGWYYDGIEDLSENERLRLGIPQGDVIEIEVADYPSYSGEAYYGEGEVVVNDVRLSAIAEKFYEFYSALTRKAEFSTAQNEADFVGKYVSSTDVETGRTMFVLGQNFSWTSQTTSLNGLLGEFVPPVTKPPIARISGLTRIETSGVNADVNLTASRSTDPQNEDLTYVWEEGGTQVDTGVNLNLTNVTAGEHTYDLTVTNTSGLSDTTSVKVDIVTEAVELDGFYNLETEKFRETGAARGKLRLTPTQTPKTDAYGVEYRKAVGKEIDESDPFVEATYDVTNEWYEIDVDLVSKHNSHIEVKIEYPDRTETRDARIATFEALPYANLISQQVTLEGQGQIIVSARGDSDTRTTDGIRIEVADTQGGLDSAPDQLFDNPAVGVNVGSVAKNETKYVRITAITDSDGSDGDQYVSKVTNSLSVDDPEFSEIIITDGGIIRGENGEIVFYDTGGVNNGTLVVDTIKFNGELDQVNSNILRVEDSYITVNQGQTGTPSLNGGLIAERGDLTDVKLEWDEGLDRWGVNAGTFYSFAVNDGTLQTDLDADTVDGYHGNDLGALSEDEIVEGAWNFENGLSVNGQLVVDGENLNEIVSLISNDAFAFVEMTDDGGFARFGTNQGAAFITANNTGTGDLIIDTSGNGTFAAELTVESTLTVNALIDGENIDLTPATGNANIYMESNLADENFTITADTDKFTISSDGLSGSIEWIILDPSKQHIELNGALEVKNAGGDPVLLIENDGSFDYDNLGGVGDVTWNIDFDNEFVIRSDGTEGTTAFRIYDRGAGANHFIVKDGSDYPVESTSSFKVDQNAYIVDKLGVGVEPSSDRLHVGGNLRVDEVAFIESIAVGESATERFDHGTFTDGVIELIGPTSSAGLMVQDGNGRIQLKWNAGFGTGETFLEGGENAGFWEFDPSSPNDELFTVSWDDGSGATAGDPITWEQIFSLGWQTLIYTGSETRFTKSVTIGANASPIDDLYVVGGATFKATSPQINLTDTSGSGAPTLHFRNESAGIDWDIYLDGSDSNDLKFDYEGTTIIRADGAGVGILGPAGGGEAFRVSGNAHVANASLLVSGDGSTPELRLSHGGSNLYATIEGPSNRTLRIDIPGNDSTDGLLVRADSGAGYVNSFFVGTDGIGFYTDSPTQDMELARSGPARFDINDTAAGVTLKAAASSGGAFVGTATNDDYHLQTDGNNRVKITAAGNTEINLDILSNSYVAKQSAWEIENDGSADFRRIYTDELVAKTFTVDLTQALAGSDFLTKSVATLASSFTVPTQGNTATLTVNDLPGNKGVQAFSANDWVRLRVVDNSGGGLTIVDAWGIVTSYVDNTDGTQSWTFTRQDADVGADGATVQENAPALDYGQSGQGIISRSVEDYPIVKVSTWTGDPSVPGNFADRFVYGDIGQAVSGASGWGLVTDNVYLGDPQAEHLHATDSGLTIYDSTGTAALADVSGAQLTLGQTDSAYATFGGSQIAMYDTAGDPHLVIGTDLIRIGNPANDFIEVSSTSVRLLDGGTTLTEISAGVVTLGDEATENIKIDNSSIEFRDGTSTVVGKIAATDWVLGQSGAGQNNVRISPTSVELREGTTDIAVLSGSTLTLGDTGAAHTIINASEVNLFDANGDRRTYVTTGLLDLGKTDEQFVRVEPAAITFRDGAAGTVRGSLSATQWILGEVGAGKNNTRITNSSIELRENTTAYAQLSGSTLTLGANGDEQVTIDSTGIYLKEGSPGGGGQTLASLRGSSFEVGVLGTGDGFLDYSESSGLTIEGNLQASNNAWLFNFDGSGQVANGNISWDAQGRAYVRGLSTYERTDKGEAGPMSQAATSVYVAPDNETVTFTSYEDDTTIFVKRAGGGDWKKSFTITNAMTSVNDASASKGDIYKSDKPVRASSVEFPQLPALCHAGRRFTFHTNRNANHTVSIWAPFADATVEVWGNASPDNRSTGNDYQTVNVSKGDTGTATLTFTTGDWRIESDEKVVVWKESNGSTDLFVVPPVSKDSVDFEGGTVVHFDTGSITGYSAVGAYTNGSHQLSTGAFTTTKIGDGSGSSAATSVPIAWLGDTYIVDETLNFQIVAPFPCVVRVYDDTGSLVTAVDGDGIIDLEAATPEAPQGFTYGSDDTGSGGGPYKIVGTAPFALRSNNPLDHEYIVAGYDSAKRGAIEDGIVRGGFIRTGRIESEDGTTYIDLDDGTFDFGSGNLTWNGSTLDVTGTIHAEAGDIANWSIGTNTISNTTGGTSLTLDSSNPWILLEDDNAREITFGDLGTGVNTTTALTPSSGDVDNGGAFVSAGVDATVDSTETVTIDVSAYEGDIFEIEYGADIQEGGPGTDAFLEITIEVRDPLSVLLASNTVMVEPSANTEGSTVSIRDSTQIRLPAEADEVQVDIRTYADNNGISGDDVFTEVSQTDTGYDWVFNAIGVDNFIGPKGLALTSDIGSRLIYNVTNGYLSVGDMRITNDEDREGWKLKERPNGDLELSHNGTPIKILDPTDATWKDA